MNDRLSTREQLVRLHPVNLLADRLDTRGGALVVVVAVGLGATALFDVAGASTASGGALLLTFLLAGVAPEPVPTTREERERRLQDATDAYSAGRMSHAEFEERVGFLLDDRNVAIRRLVEPAEKVGPARSAAIAAHFDDVGQVLDADVAELAEVDDVGEVVATNVAQHLRHEVPRDPRPPGEVDGVPA